MVCGVTYTRTMALMNILPNIFADLTGCFNDEIIFIDSNVAA